MKDASSKNQLKKALGGLPFNKVMRKHWLSRELPSTRVLEIPDAAARQGPVGVGKFAHDDSRNAVDVMSMKTVGSTTNCRR